MSKTVFISRELKSHSPIREVLADHTIIGRSLIEFSPLEFEAPQADWIFFYSRKGVKFFFEGGNYALFPYQWACLSAGTEDELSHYVNDISFVGNGSPDDVAEAFGKTTNENEVTCFVRAENSLDSVHKKLNKPQDFSIPVYQNTIAQNIPTDAFDVLIFTSPLNVDAWTNRRKIENETVVSIGKTTARHLHTLGIKDVIIANEPSEQSIAATLQQLLKN